MTYEEAIQELSHTPFDVSFSGGAIQVWENVGGLLEKRGEPVSFSGDWEEAIVKGTELSRDLSLTPSKKRRSRSRKKKM